jgi:hypothetical protein
MNSCTRLQDKFENIGTEAELRTQPVFTLVHGTFDSGATWVQSESSFSLALKDALGTCVDAVIKPFKWSGKNTLRARILAQGRLRYQLRKLLNEYPQAKHFCVGYSHGGSVVSYALSDQVLAERVSGVVFMATPFIYPRARQWNFLDRLIVLLGFIFVSVPSWILYAIYGWHPLVWAACLAIPFGVFSVWLRKRVDAWTSWSHRVSERIPVHCSISSKALLIRSREDEASGALAAAAVGTWLQVTILGVLYSVSEWLMRWGQEIASKPVPKEGPAHPFGPLLGLLRFLIQIAVLILSGVASIPTLVGCMLWGLAFGRDVARHSAFLRMSAEPSPDGTWTIVQVGPVDKSWPEVRGLRSLIKDLKAWPLAHRIHEHPDVPALIADWAKSLIGLAKQR